MALPFRLKCGSTVKLLPYKNSTVGNSCSDVASAFRPTL